MSLVEVNNIYAEDLFKWFFVHIMDSCGDGAGAIVCENYQEVSEWFLEWLEDKYPVTFSFFHDKDEYGDIINFHDSNENFMFCYQIPEMFNGDYIFVVKGDCHFGEDNVGGKLIRKYIPCCV